MVDKRIKIISISDLDKLGIVFTDQEVKTHCIIKDDKLEIPMLIEFKEDDDDKFKTNV